MFKRTLFLLSIYIAFANAANQDLIGFCHYYKGGSALIPFRDYVYEKTVNWNLIDALPTRGGQLGAGSFGKVVLASYPGIPSADKTVAIKKITPAKNFPVYLIANEVRASIKMNASAGSPRFYGCVYTVDAYGQETIYIVSEKMNTHLLDRSFRSFVRSREVPDNIRLFRNLFEGLSYLWEFGYVHNDIKPENMMTTTGNSKLVLIDYGLVQRKTEPRNSNGSSQYMSPGKLKSAGASYTESDDLYSLALSISEIFSKNLDDAFTDPATRRFVPDYCYSPNNKPSCQEQLQRAAISILSPIFGEYQNASTQARNPNFTTLIANLISYKSNSLSYAQVLAEIDAMIPVAEVVLLTQTVSVKMIENYENESAELRRMTQDYKSKVIETNKVVEKINELVGLSKDANAQIYRLNKNKQAPNYGTDLKKLQSYMTEIENKYEQYNATKMYLKKQLKVVEKQIADFKNAEMMQSQMRRENRNFGKAYFQNEENERVAYVNRNALLNNKNQEVNQQMAYANKNALKNRYNQEVNEEIKLPAGYDRNGNAVRNGNALRKVQNNYQMNEVNEQIRLPETQRLKVQNQQPAQIKPTEQFMQKNNLVPVNQQANKRIDYGKYYRVI